MPTTPGSRTTAAPSRSTPPAPVAHKGHQAPQAARTWTDLLTTAEVAKRLRVDPRTVRRYIDARELPGYRVGRGYRVDPVDLAAYLNGRRA